MLMIKTADQTVFLNSKKNGEIVNLYNTIKDNNPDKKDDKN
ncbi:MAG: hypothetical protein ACLT33_07380 [Lachnospira pectinoschiza]